MSTKNNFSLSFKLNLLIIIVFFQIRKNFFPPRPKWRRRRPKIEGGKAGAVSKLPSSQDELAYTDSGFGSQESKLSHETDDSQRLKSLETKESTDAVDFGGEVLKVEDVIVRIDNTKNATTSVGCNSEGKLPLDFVKEQEKDMNSDPESKMCLTCTVNPKDGAFSHGKIIHVCCCYQCATRIWREKKICPICKRKITNVQKVFYN